MQFSGRIKQMCVRGQNSYNSSMWILFAELSMRNLLRTRFQRTKFSVPKLNYFEMLRQRLFISIWSRIFDSTSIRYWHIDHYYSQSFICIYFSEDFTVAVCAISFLHLLESWHYEAAWCCWLGRCCCGFAIVVDFLYFGILRDTTVWLSANAHTLNW